MSDYSSFLRELLSITVQEQASDLHISMGQSPIIRINGREKARFRVNIFFQRGSISSALRLIPAKIPTLEELNLPSTLYEFTKPSQGFVLITGPSSHGKSTTLACLINEINKTRNEHIITIEDPIEYIFEDDKCVIDQREVY